MKNFVIRIIWCRYLILNVKSQGVCRMSVVRVSRSATRQRFQWQMLRAAAVSCPDPVLCTYSADATLTSISGLTLSRSLEKYDSFSQSLLSLLLDALTYSNGLLIYLKYYWNTNYITYATSRMLFWCTYDSGSRLKKVKFSQNILCQCKKSNRAKLLIVIILFCVPIVFSEMSINS